MFFAKKLVLALLAIGIAVGLAACGDDSNNKPNPLTLAITNDNAEKFPAGIFDDNHSTVYIKVDRPVNRAEDAAVAELMIKKRRWEDNNPGKRTVAMAVVTGNGGGHGRPIVVGLLIHYELQQ